jgi:glucoamylase
MPATLEEWIGVQTASSARGLMRSISCSLTKTRPGFAQSVTARAGSVVASPVLAAYDPDPDYFFHWFRDSAIVMDALRLLQADRLQPGMHHAFVDYVNFSLSLQDLDGESLVKSSGWRAAAAPDFQQFLRGDADLGSVHGAQVSADTRVNPDGTLDISQWARPQYDGAALRALTLLRWLTSSGSGELDPGPAEQLLRIDLANTQLQCRNACFDIWEEEKGFHYYTLRVCAAALLQGAEWLGARGEWHLAVACRASGADILMLLDRYWRAGDGYYGSRVLESGAHSAKDLDFAVILASLHGGARDGPHSVADPRMQATFEKLADLFAAEYPLNRDRDASLAPAMGRYAHDKYYSGGPYFFSTLGAAEFCYRLAAGRGPSDSWAQRGDAHLRTVRRYAPEDGAFAEQFDRDSGRPCSARDLAWSHAAFLSCAHARRLI